MPMNSDQTAIHVQPDGSRWGKFPYFDEVAQVTQIVRRDVTLNFSAPVYAGPYFNDDPWLMDAGNGIHIASKLPAQADDIYGKKIHGCMRNPDPTQNFQGFHQTQFDNTAQILNVQIDSWNEAVNETFPATLQAGDCFLAAVSRLPGENTNWSKKQNAGQHPLLQSVEPFTCVARAPKPTDFRPAPTDRKGTRYSTEDVDMSLLPSLSTSNITMPAHVDYDGYQAGDAAIAYHIRGTERMRPNWLGGVGSRFIHPMKHCEDYHEQLGEFDGEALCMLATDLSEAEKQPLALNMIQNAIDQYHAGIQSGEVDSAWWSATLLLAGKLLGNDDMLNCYVNGTMLKQDRAMQKIYYIEDRLDQTDTYRSAGLPASNHYTNVHKAYFRKQLNAAEEFEQRMPEDWDENDFKNESYRVGNDSKQLMGMAFFTTALGVQDKHNHPATYEYAIRFMVTADTAAELALIAPQHQAGWGYAPQEASKSADSSLINGMYAEHAASFVWPADGGNSTQTGW